VRNEKRLAEVLEQNYVDRPWQTGNNLRDINRTPLHYGTITASANLLGLQECNEDKDESEISSCDYVIRHDCV
jgi:hypothetical protein